MCKLNSMAKPIMTHRHQTYSPLFLKPAVSNCQNCHSDHGSMIAMGDAGNV